MLNSNLISEKVSYQIWILKIIAIFLVFFAHMPVSDITLALSPNYTLMNRLFSLLGMLGVPMFFFLSGFLFKPGQIKKRAKSLLIPLIIWGAWSYLLHCFKAGLASFSITDMGLWIIGSNSYLYFVTVLFVIILLYNLCDNDLPWILLGVTAVGLYQYHIVSYITPLTPYLNPLNFIAYFAFGHIVRRNNLWHKLESWHIAGPAFLLILISVCLTDLYVHVWYFNLWSMVICVSFICTLLALTSHFIRRNETFIRFGECTFVIYLCHMPIVTTLNQIVRNIAVGPLEIIKIIIAFAAISILVVIGDIILTKLRLCRLKAFLGYRN